MCKIAYPELANNLNKIILQLSGIYVSEIKNTKLFDQSFYVVNI